MAPLDLISLPAAIRSLGISTPSLRSVVQAEHSILPFIPYNLFPTTVLALRGRGAFGAWSSVGFVHHGLPFDDTDDCLP